ncbi:response regulator transcription factor [Cytobacillus depressus]|uniref:Response regulator transcription factor n=1 Tax=Cytobacillus depressus TaxID=1602942 RepID=A0A6L3V2K3_9BACI|nr:response regulator transcription factor [Cytobacillus depressus]KAB2333137.1 response regulator transcription factor [Cytobacillus depressus]
MRRILYIEDDVEIGSWTKGDLEQRGFKVQWLQSGEGAENIVSNFDLVILDVMLPGLDGFTIGQRLKREAPHIPILMLSARTAVEDKLHGLQFADDYLTKPFHPDELAARIDVLMRRSGLSLSNEVNLGHLTVNFLENRILDRRSGAEIILTGKQYQIFMHFLRHPNQILTKEQIYEAVWGEPYIEGDKTLMVHIRYLREKVEKNPGSPEIIETIRGIGYRVKQ